MIWFIGVCLFFMQCENGDIKEIETALYLEKHYDAFICLDSLDRSLMHSAIYVVTPEFWKDIRELPIGDGQKSHFGSVWVENLKVNQDFMDRLQQLPYLTELRFTDCTFDEKTDYSMDKLKRLELLEIRSEETDTKSLPSTIYPALATCRAFGLETCVETEVDFHAVVKMPRLQGLDFVEIKQNEQLKWLFPLKDQIRHLCIRAEEVTAETIDILRQFSKLRTLRLYTKKMEEAMMEKLKELPALKNLEIACPSMTDDWLKHFENWDSLKKISISEEAEGYETKVTEEGRQFLESLPGKDIENFELNIFFEEFEETAATTD